MRGLTVFLVLAGLTLVAANVPICPAPEDGGEAILFPNVDDCTTFWECDGYTPILMSCPGFLWFNPKENVCDYPVNIEEGVCTPPTEGPTEETTEGTTEGPTEETTEGTSEGPTEETTEGTTEGPTEETTEGTTEGPTEETTEGTTEGPTEETTEGTTEGPTEETTEGTTEGPTEEMTEGPTEETTEGTSEESILLKKLMKKNYF